MQLFIASEGTLGIVSKVTFKLLQKLKNLTVCLLGLDSFEKIPKTLMNLRKKDLRLTTFEFFTQEALDVVLEIFPSSRKPFEAVFPYYLLVEVEKLYR